MYGGDIDGTTSTVGLEAMTALKRDGTALIPASLVNVLKGSQEPLLGLPSFQHHFSVYGIAGTVLRTCLRFER